MASNPFADAGLSNFGKEMSYANMGGDHKGAGPLGIGLAALINGIQGAIAPSTPMPEAQKWDLKPVVPYKSTLQLPPLNPTGVINPQNIYPKPDINMIHSQINSDWE